jgi:hypothetical protein
VDDFIGVGHYMDRYYELKKELEATVIPYNDVYMCKDMEKVMHLKILPFVVGLLPFMPQVLVTLITFNMTPMLSD